MEVTALNLICTRRLVGTPLAHVLICYWCLANVFWHEEWRHLDFLQWYCKFYCKHLLFISYFGRTMAKIICIPKICTAVALCLSAVCCAGIAWTCFFSMVDVSTFILAGCIGGFGWWRSEHEVHIPVAGRVVSSDFFGW